MSSEIIEAVESIMLGVNVGGSGFNEGVPVSSLAAVASTDQLEEEEDQEAKARKTRVVACSKISLQLYKTAIRGDWEMTRVLISSKENALSEPITQASETILHVAVSQPNMKFIKELLNSITKNQLEQKDHLGRTALCPAAIAGNTDAVKLLVKAHPSLPSMLSNRQYSPLHYAMKYGHKETVQYLMSVTEFDYQLPHLTASGVTLLKLLVYANFFGLACDQLKKLPDYSLKEDGVGKAVFETLAHKTYAFHMQDTS